MNLSALKSANWYLNDANWLPVLKWIAWIFVVFLLAKIFWIWTEYFMDTDETQLVVSNQPVQQKSNTAIDISQLLQMELFGSLQQVQAPVAQVENVPETKLNLVLRGVYFADEKSKANAVIENGRGKQDVYFIDEALKDVSGQVYLKEVYFNKVVIETNGKRETLSMEDEELAQFRTGNRQQFSAQASIQDKRGDSELTHDLSEYKEQLLDNPMSLMQIISIERYLDENQQLQGLKVSPGSDPQLFKKAGLKRGDIVTAVNGIPLDSMQDISEILGDVDSLDQISLQLLRGEEVINLLLNLQP